MTRHLCIHLSEKLSLRKPRWVFVLRIANCHPTVTLLHITLEKHESEVPYFSTSEVTVTQVLTRSIQEYHSQH